MMKLTDKETPVYSMRTLKAIKVRNHLAGRWSLVLLAVTAAIGLAAAAGTNGSVFGQPVPSAAPPPRLAKDKLTTVGLYVTAREAYEKWNAEPNTWKVLDVRTPEEFVFVGHADMASNIPFSCVTYEGTGGKDAFGMVPDPGFVSNVRRWAQPTDAILVMCRSGGRSAEAVNALAASGFKTVYSVTDGFEGDTVDDPDSVFQGKRMKNGWKNAGLPWTYRVAPEQMVLPKAR